MQRELQEYGQVHAVAMDDLPQGYAYSDRVKFQIQASAMSDYLRAAEFLNINQYDAVSVQFEYGIFGGPDGAYVTRLLESLHMPILSTQHTALTNPTRGQRKVAEEVTRFSDRLVVISHKAGQIMQDVYGVPAEKLVHIPHGIPDVPFSDPAFFKDLFHVERNKVILTFGLLGPGKGIELMLEAIPEIVRQHPDAVCIVLGATHPALKRVEGESYRQGLYRQVERLDLSDYVFFHDRFVDLESLCQYIGAADIYVAPYPHKEQVSSGTLAYALGAGKAVVSTPFWYAEELLAEGRGRLVPFEDPGALAREVCALLSDDVERNAMRKRGYQFCRDMVWRQVGRRYVQLACEVIEERGRAPRPRPGRAAVHKISSELPELDFSHVRRLTDDTGILRHATLTIPDRAGGYWLSENALALVAICLQFSHNKKEVLENAADTYAAFISHALDREARSLRAGMHYDRTWTDRAATDETLGQTIWGLGVAVAHPPSKSIRTLCARLFLEILPLLETLKRPAAIASAVVGVHAFLEEFGGNTEARRMRTLLAERLYEAHVHAAKPDWPWVEEELGPDSAKVPEALILAGSWIPHADMREAGLRILAWLFEIQTSAGGLSPAGTHGWLRRGGEKAKFDQSPIEVAHLVEACSVAYETQEEEQWRRAAWLGYRWFLGKNDLGEPLVDFVSGGCREGLTPLGANENQGAEASLAWLICLLYMHRLLGAGRLEAEAGEAANGEDSPNGSVPVSV